MRNSTFGKLAAAGMVGALALTACGGDNGDGNGGANGEEEVELRFTWWGSDHRHQNTQAIIDDFEEEYPHISIEGEFADWAGYWDQLATQMAGGSGPDIIQLDDEYIREYADRGQLLELTDVDLSELDETIVEGGQADGAQYAIPTGVNALVMMANPDLFDEAGVELPDDTTWTWDDFEEIAETIHEETGAYALNNPIAQTLMVWMRQQGGHLFTEEGELGMTVDQAEEYLATLEHWMEIGALPSASELAEEESAVMEDSLIGTNRAALGLSWTNQLPALTEASGTELIPLRFPSSTGNAEDNGLWFKNTMLIGANAGTDHPEEVQLFIDYFINSEEAGRHNLMDRGLPANENVREVVMDEVEGQDLVAAELVTDLEGEITEPEPMLPLGFAGLSDAISLNSQNVFFGNATPREAAEAMVAEMESILESEG
ncbi:ABC transporter substrate-binding protein [Nesterenkonia alba]|uniref:ABC transporter substrate-binding protein n=1 Tax=Nesterenkonia alba TaxID=515814 RepID=UPI00041924C9|nr:extracellular solute-binding protein [Nesterenkonia alba]